MEKNRFTYSVNFSFASDCSESNNWSVFGRANCRFCSSLYDGDVILPLTILCLDCLAVVPGYYLVCYNENAVELAKQNAGYYVFDNDGNRIYPEAPAAPVAAEYKVNVTTSDLRIRKGPGTTFDYWKKDGKPVYTGKGAFTIVEEAEGPGASKWGLLKAYAAGRNGWVSLDYAKKA